MATTYDTSPYDEYYQDRLQWDADNKKAVTDAKLACLEKCDPFKDALKKQKKEKGKEIKKGKKQKRKDKIAHNYIICQVKLKVEELDLDKLHKLKFSN
tara:strand:- start:2104 stop:2397 length:294 start_codon:yes stop_codon:yes gene_type:complete